MTEKFFIADLKFMQKFARLFAESIKSPICCYLHGDLGAGKTALVQEVLKSLGITDAITSPTFTIIEHYNNSKLEIFHIDLYRIDSPDELEYTGISELVDNQAVFFIEWAEKGEKFIPQADLAIQLVIQEQGRQLTITEKSQKGSKFLIELLKNVNNKFSEINLQ